MIIRLMNLLAISIGLLIALFGDNVARERSVIMLLAAIVVNLNNQDKKK